MVTAHSIETEQELRRFAEIAGGEAELRNGFEEWYATTSRRPTADEFAEHLLKRRARKDPAKLRSRFEEILRARNAPR